MADDTYNKSPWTHDDVSNRTYFEITFIPGLKWRTNFSVDFYQYNYDGYVNSEYITKLGEPTVRIGTEE